MTRGEGVTVTFFGVLCLVSMIFISVSMGGIISFSLDTWFHDAGIIAYDAGDRFKYIYNHTYIPSIKR